jgi:hypothetical protein
MKVNTEILELTNMIHTGESDDSLTNRIMSNKTYELKEVDIEDIDLCGYSVNDNKITEYASLTSTPNPIILDSTGMVIDGVHRIEVAKMKGKETIMAYIGK